MFPFQKNLRSFLCIGSLLLYITDGFIISFPATLSSLNPSQVLNPGIEPHRSKSSISSSSGKIQEMTSLTSLASTRSGSKERAATIQGRYALAAKVSHSFITREFQPAWFATNHHFQTIIGALFRKDSMYSRSISVLLDLAGVTNSNKGSESLLLDHFTWDKRERMKTPDGDFFDVDWSLVNSKDDNNPVCLICHGLERYVCLYYLIPFFKHIFLFPFIVVLIINLLAFIYLYLLILFFLSCSDSEIAQELAIACNNANIDAACINFRGCSDKGAECNLTARGYHMGFTDDLLQQITNIHSNNPNKRIYLSGFSLGAGVVTKLLADLGEDAYRYNICGAAVNAVPFDASQSTSNLNGKGITKSLYGDRLLKSMKKRIKQQFDNSCDFPFERSKIDECETIMDIENLAIASVFGFDDAWDYYDKCKTIDKLDKISVPQLILQAKDDPFFKGMECPDNNLSFPLRIQYSERGGHCGFVCQKINEDNSQISWMPTQLGRFFAHVEENYQSTTINTEDATASLIVAK